jgi:hypothetical protein
VENQGLVSPDAKMNYTQTTRVGESLCAYAYFKTSSVLLIIVRYSL